MSSDLRSSIARIERLIQVSDDALRELRTRGQRRSGRTLPALEAWFRISLNQGVDVDAFLAELQTLGIVDHAERAPKPAPPPSFPEGFRSMLEVADHPQTPSFVDLQGYLEPAPGGIDAFYAWNFPGGNGAGFTVYDIEYSWNQTHEDLSKAAGVPILLPAGHTQRDPFNDRNHGTAVLGELIADNDDKGVTGISWGADIGLAAAATIDAGNNNQYSVANAIAAVMADPGSKPGDVILIEQQTCVCNQPCLGEEPDPQLGLGPSEWVQSVYDATVTATAAGYIVVAAAGNGSVNLNQEDCDGLFDGTARANSGAIIVGAGDPDTRARLGFSCFGGRVDLQGWGTNVMTTGYGTPDFPDTPYRHHDDPDNEDFWYRRSFGGTSSASPIVSGAVLNLQGINWAENGTLLSANQVRTILRNTGTPQGGDTNENIGPLPNLRMAIAQIINVPPVADAGPDQTIECECFDGAEVTLDGSGSFDDNGDPLTYSWTLEGEEIATGVGPTVTLPLGMHVITLTVSDLDGLSDDDTVTITVEDTTPPVVTLLGDNPMTIECGIDDYIEPGADIEDICDPDPSLEIDASDVDTHTVGEYEVDYTGTDASLNSVVVKRTVNVVDTTPPTITVNSPPTVLWSPNHQYRTIALSDLDIEVDDACDKTLTPEDVVIVSVTSDEPENANGNGDGNTLNDMVIGESCNVVQLRAERAASGNGRVYTLRLELMDASGNVGWTTYEVHVPRDQRPGSVAVADAPVYTVSAEACEPVFEGGAAVAGGTTEIRSNIPSGIADADLPQAFDLAQNHPNPFNPITAISYSLPEAVNVRLSIFNMLGQEVARLVDHFQDAGRYEARFNASGLPSGMYIYSISAGAFQASKTMVLLK